MKKVKLFCIPHSGSSATVYLVWKKILPNGIELIPVELKGHGSRMREPLFKNVEEAVDDVVKTISSQLSKEDSYVILGHSMGSVLAYEAYYKLKEMGYPEPLHMFFSGRKSSINSEVTTEFYKKPDEEFLETVYKYGGTTKELMANLELRELFLPILRADFKIAETYYCTGKPGKMQCNITVSNGREDRSIVHIDMSEWCEITEKSCQIRFMPGDHFYLFQNGGMMLNMIENTLIEEIKHKNAS